MNKKQKIEIINEVKDFVLDDREKKVLELFANDELKNEVIMRYNKDFKNIDNYQEYADRFFQYWFISTIRDMRSSIISAIEEVPNELIIKASLLSLLMDLHACMKEDGSRATCQHSIEDLKSAIDNYNTLFEQCNLLCEFSDENFQNPTLN